MSDGKTDEAKALEFLTWIAKREGCIQFAEWNTMVAVDLFVNNKNYEAHDYQLLPAIEQAWAEAKQQEDGK